MTRRFTGRHMAAILIAFFGTIIAVNFTMASYASATFSGTVVDSSYVATRKFNSWLAEARAQERLGWDYAVTLDDARRPVLIAALAGGAPLAGGAVEAVARHPVGRRPDVPLTLAEVEPGIYRAAAPLPAGRWKVHFTLRHGGSEKKLIETLR